MNLISSNPNTSRINPRYFYLEIPPSRFLDLAFVSSRIFLRVFKTSCKPRRGNYISRMDFLEKKTRGFKISRPKKNSRDFNTSSFFPRQSILEITLPRLVKTRGKNTSPRRSKSSFNRYNRYIEEKIM